MAEKGKAEAATFSTESTTGSQFRTKYLDRERDTVPVDMDDLEEFKSSSVEEFKQFAIGEFLVAGAFWLGVERAFTVEDFWKGDLLFWACFFAFLAGLVVAYFGYTQMGRRQTKIDKIIASAKEKESGGTA